MRKKGMSGNPGCAMGVTGGFSLPTKPVRPGKVEMAIDPAVVTRKVAKTKAKARTAGRKRAA